MDKFIILIIIGLLTCCSSHQRILDSDQLSTINKLGLKDAVDLEQKIGSKDKTPDHPINISPQIYPNKNNYELAIPRTFLRVGDYFETQLEYYYSTPDNSVRAILYQWDRRDLKSYETKKELVEKFKRFKRQWNDITKELNEGLGLPTSKETQSDKYGDKIIEDNQSDEEIMASIGNDSDDHITAWVDYIKWDKDNVHAYLYMFGDNKTGYRQIRLAIYGE